jgi:hypothetical protein
MPETIRSRSTLVDKCWQESNEKKPPSKSQNFGVRLFWSRNILETVKATASLLQYSNFQRNSIANTAFC